MGMFVEAGATAPVEVADTSNEFIVAIIRRLQAIDLEDSKAPILEIPEVIEWLAETIGVDPESLVEVEEDDGVG